jgi:hypothetical protein
MGVYCRVLSRHQGERVVDIVRGERVEPYEQTYDAYNIMEAIVTIFKGKNETTS